MIRSLLAALILVLVPHCASAQDEEPIRILLHGDSITQGKPIALSGGYSWRYFLDKSATGPIDFVGNRTGPSYGQGEPDQGIDGYADPDFDYDHAGVAGAEICKPTALEGQVRIDELVQAYHPDVIVGAFGINDLRRGKTVDQVLDCYDTWVAQARSADPDIQIVITRLPWSFADPDGETFNTRLQNWAGARTTAGSPIVLAQMAEEYDASDTYDGLHPNRGGEEKVARMMASALAKQGVPFADAAPLLGGNAFAPVPPAEGRLVSVARDGSYLVVKWAARARVEKYLLRCAGVDRWYHDQVLSARFVENRSVRCYVRAKNHSGLGEWSDGIHIAARRRH